MRSRGSMRGLIIIAVIIATDLAAAGRARAQGTAGMLPNPISTREIASYAARLKLSEPQRRAVESFHDGYKHEFRALRQGEIAGFMREMYAMSGIMPKRQQVEDFIKNLTQINGKIAALDNRLFDQMQAVLSEEQVVLMPRVRQARQRARYAAQQSLSMTGHRVVDLSDIVLQLDLPPEEWEAANVILAPYESRLTSQMAKLSEAAGGTIVSMFDVMESLGFTEESMQDPQAMEKFMAGMQQAWRDIIKKSSELAAECADLSRRTYRQVAAALPAESARRLRKRFYQQAYPEAAYALNDEPDPFAAALTLEGLTQQQRQGVLEGREQTRAQVDRLVEELVTALDDSRREFSPFDFNSEQMQERNKKLSDVMQRVGQSRENGRQQLLAILGTDLAAKLNKIAPAGSVKMPTGMELATGAVVTGDAGEPVDEGEDEVDADGQPDDASPRVASAWGSDEFVAPAISAAELADYLSQLPIREEQRAPIQQLHQAYQEQFKSITENQIAAITKLYQSMWQPDPVTHQAAGMTLANVDELHRLRRAASAAVSAADARFFDDLELALDVQQLARLKSVRLQRERVVFNRGRQSMYWLGGGSNESAVDLVRLLRQQRIGVPLSEDFQAELGQYEAALTQAMRARFNASLDHQRAQDRWNAEMIKAQAEGGQGSAVALASRYKEFLGEPGRALNDADDAISQLNRQALERAMAKLPDEAAASLRAAYNREAFPSIYTDHLCVERQLVEALKLSDLTDQQRQSLTEVLADYRPSYAHLSEQMAQATSQRPGNYMAMDDRDEMRRLMQQQEAIATIGFDRRELNQRAASRLRAILSEDQLKRAGGLPKPQDEDQNDFDGW